MEFITCLNVGYLEESVTLDEGNEEIIRETCDRLGIPVDYEPNRIEPGQLYELAKELSTDNCVLNDCICLIGNETSEQIICKIANWILANCCETFIEF